MLKVGQLLKFISDLNPQNTPTRLSFYNFLRGFADTEEPLTAELISLFFNSCLDYPHWATNKVQLGNEVQYLLENFNSYYQRKFDLSLIQFPQNMQLVEIEHFSDLIDASNHYLKTIYSPEDKIKILSDQNKRIVAIVLKSDRSLEVRTIDRKFTLRKGILEPLRKDLVLYYNPKLELSSTHVHKIEIAPYITAQFRMNGDKVTGSVLRGYVYQKLCDLKNDSLQEQTRLLFPIKRLEQFFIDRRTDPYYQDILQQLERAKNLIQNKDPEALKWSQVAIAKAETALEHVFIGDKFLTLLIRDLKHEAKEECQKISPLNGYDLTNS